MNIVIDLKCNDVLHVLKLLFPLYILGLFIFSIPELYNVSWQRTTAVTVGFFSGHKCENNIRWNSYRLTTIGGTAIA